MKHLSLITAGGFVGEYTDMAITPVGIAA